MCPDLVKKAAYYA
jgi:serine/threonine protein kinase